MNDSDEREREMIKKSRILSRRIVFLTVRLEIKSISGFNHHPDVVKDHIERAIADRFGERKFTPMYEVYNKAMIGNGICMFVRAQLNRYVLPYMYYDEGRIDEKPDMEQPDLRAICPHVWTIWYLGDPMGVECSICGVNGLMDHDTGKVTLLDNNDPKVKLAEFTFEEQVNTSDTWEENANGADGAYAQRTGQGHLF